MKVTDKELEGNQLLAGLAGFNKDRDQTFYINGVIFVQKKNVLSLVIDMIKQFHLYYV